jgi:hypothetical protein
VNIPAGHAAPVTREKIVTEHSKWLMYADYDPVSLRFEVGFKNGRIVQHWPVYPQTWLDFKVAPSKGSFYTFAIKKVTPPVEVKA